jgi:hypothetical protein
MNPLAWKRSHQAAALALIAVGTAIGGIIGYNWAWNIITREHLRPTDPYIPIIYEKFMAAWAIELGFIVALLVFIFHTARKSRTHSDIA